MNLFWLVQTAAYLSLIALLVPKNYIKRLLLFAVLGGIIYTTLVQYVAVNILDLWRYEHTLVSNISGVPLFFVTSWFAVTLLYGFFLLRYPSFQIWIFLLFVLLTACNNLLAYSNDVIHFINWSLTETFMFALFSHVILLYFLKHLHNTEELGAGDNIIGDSLSILKRDKRSKRD